MTLEADEALASFAAAVDDKVGLIRSIDFVALSERDPAVYLAHATPADTRSLTDLQAANRGAACAWTADRAALRACGESVERYCAAICDLASLRLASEAQLSEEPIRFVRVADLYPFSESQYAASGFPFERIEATQPIRWSRGSTLDGEGVLIPASCTYVPYFFEPAIEPFSHMPISTGLAAGRSVDRCIEKGICEILERDALMIVWLHRWRAPRIEPASCLGFSDEIDGLLAAGRMPGTRWFLNYLTLDVDVPIVSAALIDDSGAPLTSFGIAADIDPMCALRGALEEALLTRLLVNRSRVEAPGEGEKEAVELRTLRGHLLAHAGSPALREAMRFLTDEGAALDFASLAAGMTPFAKASDRCRLAGLEPVWTEITTTDVAELGFKVVRTVIPSAQPLDNDHHFAISAAVGSSRCPTPWAGRRECPTASTPTPIPSHDRDGRVILGCAWLCGHRCPPA
ncbi:MAG: ribosomal protein methylthiotransferase accessory factor [Sphingomonadales bacterium]|jgi:ribosomal protein S12 methylthiotransferase accessory factor|nr:ribosomal protein methylthiotransferase accessory factor [Sphingomonadales bacterium]